MRGAGNATAAALRAAAPAPAPPAQPRRQLLIHACGPVTAFSSVLSELLAFVRHRETSESTAEPTPDPMAKPTAEPA